jgi:16S rRNA (uracil1498-N3)-methyltransferase
MRVPRFFSPVALAEGHEVALDPSAAQHAVAVLRLAVGAPLTLFDGSGGEHAATLVQVGRSVGRARVGPKRAVEREPPFPLVLGQALAKGERMDLVVQKATELGATALVPLATERSEVRLDAERAAKRVAHWQGVVRAACEQCGRNRLPEVGAPRSLDAFLAAPPGGASRLVLAPEGVALRDLPRPGAAGVVLLVGPEGGLSEAELARATAAGFVGASLGPRVLRTETAALAALAAVQAVWG